MANVLPIVLGVLGGILGSCAYPIVFSHLFRKRSRDVIPGVVAVCVSLLLSVAVILLGKVMLRETFVPFAVAFLVVYLVVVIAATVWFVRKPRN